MFFTNSGTEANELALMIARLYTGCHDIISLRNAYHGNAAGTMGATAQCNWKFNVIQVHMMLEDYAHIGITVFMMKFFIAMPTNVDPYLVTIINNLNMLNFLISITIVAQEVVQ